jgi:cytochrome bd-type quinol oxidase subunit 2
VGVAISVPAIAAYTVLAYRVFRGKVRELRYA